MSIIDYFDDRINESYKLDIITMFDNIQKYDYYDLFDTDMSFNTLKIIQDRNKYTLLKPKRINYIKSTVISSDKTKIYKMYIFQNDNKYKEYLILNLLIETYFQIKFREHIINNNITNLIVPEIYRYGIINIEQNNEVICFAEMQYYDNTSIYELNTELKQQQTTKQKLEKIYDYLNNFKSIINVIVDLEKQTQIYHNDIVYDINQLQNILTRIKSYVNSDSDNTNCKDYLDSLLIEDEWNNSHINGIYNLFLSNNKYILIDFEDSSINQTKLKKRINYIFSTSPTV
jgi:hypothetical protein